MTRLRPLLVLATCCLSLLLVTMDLTIVNVALPSIRRDLHASVAGLQWSIDGYTVVVASFLMLSGSMADRFGRRRTFQLGLAVFILGSLLCSLAPTTNALVGCRMLQALGGSMLNPVAMSIVVNTFTDLKERARAIGVWGAIFGVSMAAGPLLGGALVDSIGWRSIFWVNVPVGVLALALSARFIPESRADRPRRFDLVAQALIIVGLLALTSAVIDGRRAGWSSWTIVARFGVALASVVALVAWESRRAEPLLDMRFFRSLPFSSATALAVLSFAAFSGFLFLNSLYLQESRGLSASAAGLTTLPIAFALVVCSPLSGRLVGAGHARFAFVVAGAGISCGALMLTGLANDTPLPVLIAAYAIFGVGLGSIGAPVNTAAVSGMPRSQAGLAAAVASTSRQVGAALGVALAGSLAGGGIEVAHRADLAESTHPVFWVIVACGVAIVVLGVVSTGRRARASAERVASLLGAPDIASPAAAPPDPGDGLGCGRADRVGGRAVVSDPLHMVASGGQQDPLGVDTQRTSQSRAARVLAFPLTRIVLATVVVALPVIVTMALAHATLERSMRVAWPQLLSAALCIGAYRLYVRRIERRVVSELSGAGALREIGTGLLIGVSLLAVTVAFLAAVRSYHVSGRDSWTVVFAPIAELTLVAAFEEIIFRGILFRIAEESLGSRIALPLSAALFALAHLPNAGVTLLAVSDTFTAGILFAAAFMATRRLWLAAGIHFAWNFTLDAVFSVTVSGHPSKGLLRGALVGPDWLTGGAYGVEGSVIALVVISAGSAYLVAVARRRGHVISPSWRRTTVEPSASSTVSAA